MVSNDTQLVHSSYMQTLCNIGALLDYEKAIQQQKFNLRDSQDDYDLEWFENFSLTVQCGVALKHRKGLPFRFTEKGELNELSKLSKVGNFLSICPTGNCFK